MTTEFTKEEIEKVAQAILKNSSSDGDVIKLGNLNLEVLNLYNFYKYFLFSLF